MTPYFIGLIRVGWPAFLVVLYAALIGLTIQSAFIRCFSLPRSLGVSTGVGLSITAVAMVYSHLLLANVSLPILPLAIVAAAVLAFRLTFASPKPSQAGQSRWHQIRSRLWNPISLTDIIAAAVTILIMAPVLKYGLTYWTIGAADFPSYASSAEIWMTSPSTFAERHPDAFGAKQLSRASHEKPMVTALLVLMSNLSRTPAYQLLSPLFFVLIFVLVASLIQVCLRVFRASYLTTTLAVLIPTFSIVPISRIYDAQLGQIGAISLIACSLALITVATYNRASSGAFTLALLTATVGVTAAGSNFSLTAGSGIVLGALFIWVLSKRPLQFTRRLKLMALCALLAAVLSAPMARMFYASFISQSNGTPGFNVQIASPLALIGQQISLTFGAPEDQILLSWCIVLAATIAILWARPSNSNRAPLDFVLVLLATLNVSLIGIKFGWNNYSVHKWAAVFIALVVPVIIIYGTSLLRERSKIAATALMIPLAGTSIYIGLKHGFSIQQVISTDLINLRNNDQLSKMDSLNIQLGNLHENSLAAIIVPTKIITVTEQTYAAASLPNNGAFLVKKSQFALDKHPNAIMLNETYAAIPTLSRELDADAVDFTNKNSDSRRFLFGSWHASEDWGTWSTGKGSYVVLELPDTHGSKNVTLTIAGMTYAPNNVSRRIDILINGKLFATQQYPHKKGGTFNIIVPHQLIAENNNRLTIDFQVTPLLSPSQFGSPDERLLGFGLSRIEVLRQ